MTNVTDVKRMPEGILDEYLTRLKNENILLSEFLKDTMDLALWSDQRRKLYMERILKVQTWAMNGREREQE